MDYYWESKPHEGYVELIAYFTRRKNHAHPEGKCVACHINCEHISEIEDTKKYFEENSKCETDMAWRPIEGAVWRWLGNGFSIDKSQMKFIGKES